MFGRRFWSVKYVSTAEFPHGRFPLVFLNGQPGYVVNQWIYYMIDAHVGQSLLEERIRAVLHLYDYCMARYGDRGLTREESVALVGDFLLAKRDGTDLPGGKNPFGLNWRPARRTTLKRYLAALNEFDIWHATFHHADRLNPSESRLMTAWERYSDFRQREKWDPMLHLFPSRSRTKDAFAHQIPEKHRRFQYAGKPLPKCFPLHAFVDLVEQCSNPRDKMLFLQLFGLGLRESEPLHLFAEDVFGVTPHGEARIRLDDPETGRWEWYDAAGKKTVSSRTDYLDVCWQNHEFRSSHRELYRLVPRTRYGRRGGMFVGFKGMTFHLDEGAGSAVFGHEAIWIDPRIGIYFRACFDEYMHENFYGKPYRWPFHPWLYIQLEKKNYGLPMTIPAVKKVWKRSMRRLGLDGLGLGPHSLRHLAGYYSASVLKHPLETTQALLRHANPISTQCYYHLSKDTVRAQIIEAAAKTGGLSISDLVVLPDSPRLDIPDHWAPGLRQKKVVR
ncbi:site-specific recombinase XerD [Burkholderia sp. Ch1-1]|nr:site-specific recombinase XerD [Burkholderia sp. Ch1-1]